MARLGWAVAGLLAGYLLLRLPDALPDAWHRLFANRDLVAAFRPTFGSVEMTRAMLRAFNVVLLALPGGLLLGALAGYALARIRHPRILCYSILAWPAWMLAHSQYRYAVLAAHSPTLQFHEWEIRNYRFFDTAVTCAVFLLCAYAAQRLWAPRQRRPA